MVGRRGFEPLISALRGRCPGPLDERPTITVAESLAHKNPANNNIAKGSKLCKAAQARAQGPSHLNGLCSVIPAKARIQGPLVFARIGKVSWASTIRPITGHWIPAFCGNDGLRSLRRLLCIPIAISLTRGAGLSHLNGLCSVIPAKAGIQGFRAFARIGKVAWASTIGPICGPLDSRFRGNDGLPSLRRLLCIPIAISLTRGATTIAPDISGTFRYRLVGKERRHFAQGRSEVLWALPPFKPRLPWPQCATLPYRFTELTSPAGSAVWSPACETRPGCSDRS